MEECKSNQELKNLNKRLYSLEVKHEKNMQDIAELKTYNTLQQKTNERLIVAIEKLEDIIDRMAKDNSKYWRSIAIGLIVSMILGVYMSK